MVGWVGGECEFGVSKHCLVSTPPPPAPRQPFVYPMSPDISLKGAQFVVSNASSHHDLRAVVVLFVLVLS